MKTEAETCFTTNLGGKGLSYPDYYNILLLLSGVDPILSLCLDTKEATCQGEPSSCCGYPFLYYIQILVCPFPFLLRILLIHSLSFSLRGGKRPSLHWVALYLNQPGHPLIPFKRQLPSWLGYLTSYHPSFLFYYVFCRLHPLLLDPNPQVWSSNHKLWSL